MPDDASIPVAADIARTAAMAQLKAAVAAATEPVAQLKAAFADVGAAASREASRIARPYRRAFDEIGAGWKSAVAGLVEGTLTFQSAALKVTRSVERGFIDIAGTTLSRAAAGPLASLLGQAAPSASQASATCSASPLGGWLSGGPQQLGAAASTANTTALAANTAALATLTASLGATAAVSGAGAVGSLGAASAAGAAAGSGGLFGFLGGLFAFAGGGIVPSAAGGWALPNFPGARPALLHAREMVLPAPISEGLQQMIAEGGPNGAAGGDMHLHFHGPSDGPAVERWFTGLLARSPQTVRNMLRSNALTPRSL